MVAFHRVETHCRHSNAGVICKRSISRFGKGNSNTSSTAPIIIDNVRFYDRMMLVLYGRAGGLIRLVAGRCRSGLS